MKQLLAFALALFAAAAGQAVAGGSVTIEMTGRYSGPMEVSWRDDSVKIDPSDRPAYMLMHDGSLYSVSTAGNRTVVMDLSAMQERMRGSKRAVTPATGLRRISELVSMEPAGDRETVAGIGGEVYRVTWKDVDGVTHTDDAVLTVHDKLVAMAVAMKGFAERAATGETGPDVLGERLAAEGLGLLRFGDRYRVIEVSTTEPPAAAFELPAEPVAVPERS